MWPFKKNDWKPVWVDTITAQVQHNIIDNRSGKVVSSCIENRDLSYEILYSKSRNEYKLTCRGKDAELNDNYKFAVQILNEYINGKEN